MSHNCTMLICVTLGILVLNLCVGQLETTVEISVLHFNDFHARFEETDINGNTCKNKSECIGGFSRLYSEINKGLSEKPDAVVLNAGDSFQGTLWYTVGKWNVTQEYMNMIPIDAEVFGNHDFDDGIAGVVPYVTNLLHPMVACNIDDSLEPTIQGIYSKSKVIIRNGLKIGIIGVVMSTCNLLANTEKLRFYPESPSVNAEAERLVREEGVFTNIVLSHSGYDIDQGIAKNASKTISLIVGGHTHSFLFTGENPPGVDPVQGDYPTVVESKDGHKVLVVQASAFARYLGNITVYYNEYGEVTNYSGAPIYLSVDHPQDEAINALLQPWKDIVDKQGPKVLGSTMTLLSNSDCFNFECTLGNFVADAMVYAYTESADQGSWTEAALAVTNAGGLRANIDIGEITYNDVVVAQPFENTFDIIELEGRYLRELFEYTSTFYGDGDNRLNLLQLSGFRIKYDLSRPIGHRVKSIEIRCQNCTVPIYEKLEDDKVYTVVANSFMLKEDSRFLILTKNMKNRRVGRVDIDVIIDYLSHRSPVFEETGNRLMFLP